jgi:hypothetical protein
MSRRMRAGLIAAAACIGATSFSQPALADWLAPNRYAHQSCFGDLWESDGWPSYNACFTFHKQQYINDVCGGDQDYC